MTKVIDGKEITEKLWTYFELSDYKYLSSKGAISEVSRALIDLGIEGRRVQPVRSGVRTGMSLLHGLIATAWARKVLLT